MNDILKKVIEITCDQMGVQEHEIDPEANIMDSLRADSLDMVEIIISVEDEFNIEIPDEDAEVLFTINDVVEYVERKLA